MGDRTYVTLSVLKTQEREAASHFPFDPEEDWLDDQLAHFGFPEINYGNLGFLFELRAAGIAYDSRWESGGDYGAGTESLRFTSLGEAIEKTVYDSGKNPDLGYLMDRIDKPEELRDYILEHYDEVTNLDWENQEKYGKLYQARKLIDPT
jgi:hypothetical protein